MEVYIMIFHAITTLSYDVGVIQFIVPCNKYDITTQYITSLLLLVMS